MGTHVSRHAAPARDEIDEAVSILDTHITSSGTGRCIKCGVFGPCPTRTQGLMVMTRALWLPRRKPGVTQPELVGAKRIGAPSVFL